MFVKQCFLVLVFFLLWEVFSAEKSGKGVHRIRNHRSNDLLKQEKSKPDEKRGEKVENEMQAEEKKMKQLKAEAKQEMELRPEEKKAKELRPEEKKVTQPEKSEKLKEKSPEQKLNWKELTSEKICIMVNNPR